MGNYYTKAVAHSTLLFCLNILECKRQPKYHQSWDVEHIAMPLKEKKYSYSFNDKDFSLNFWN